MFEKSKSEQILSTRFRAEKIGLIEINIILVVYVIINALMKYIEHELQTFCPSLFMSTLFVRSTRYTPGNFLRWQNGSE